MIRPFLVWPQWGNAPGLLHKPQGFIPPPRLLGVDPKTIASGATFDTDVIDGSGFTAAQLLAVVTVNDVNLTFVAVEPLNFAQLYTSPIATMGTALTPQPYPFFTFGSNPASFVVTLWAGFFRLRFVNASAGNAVLTGGSLILSTL